MDPIEIEVSTWVFYYPPQVTREAIEIVTSTSVVFTPPGDFLDTEGEATVQFVVQGLFDVTTQPVSVPLSLDYESIKRISVTMPTPTTYDRFGRPTS
jgi:hypothetical protein